MNGRSALGKISKEALLKSGVAKTEEEADKIIAEEEAYEIIKRLESQNSIIAAMNAIKYYVEENDNLEKIPDDVFTNYTEAVLNGKEEDKVVEEMMKYTMNIDTDTLAIFAINEVHNNWIKENKIKFTDKNKWYKFLPLEFLGWREVEKDFIYVKPILESLRKEVSPTRIKNKYLKSVNKYLKANQIRNRKTLKEKLKLAIENHELLEKEEKDTLIKDENYEKVVDDVYNNGIGQDKEELDELLEDDLVLSDRKLDVLEEEGKTLDEKLKKIEELEKEEEIKKTVQAIEKSDI